MQNASYFVHLISWYERRNEHDSVLITTFEDFKEDLQGEIERIAKFVSTDKIRYDTKERIQASVERSTYAFMKEHAWHFDEKLSKRTRNQACGLAPDAGMNNKKIRSGSSNKALSDDLRDKIQKKWDEVVKPVTGCASYEELRLKLKMERR